MKITIETKTGPLNNHVKTFTVETTYEDVTSDEIIDTLLNLLQSAGYNRQNIIETFKDYDE
jgi:hypothetical protein